MCDMKKYSLISVESECIWSRTNINMSSPDLTSIITALEENNDTTDLFFSGNDKRCKNILNDRLGNLYDSLENTRIWLDQTFVPRSYLMEYESLKPCIIKLNLINGKLTQLSKITKNIMQTYKKKNLKSDVKKGYNVSCTICGKQFLVDSDKSWSEAEHHTHIAEAIATKMTLKSIAAVKTASSKTVSESSCEGFPPSRSQGDNSYPPKNFAKNAMPLCVYSDKIKQTLYPYKVTCQVSAIEQNYDFYTIQSIERNHFVCLLCKVDMYQEGSVLAHVSGQQHRCKFWDETELLKVMNYHNIFSYIPNELKIHQVVFRPHIELPYVFCKVCSFVLEESEVENHIRDTIHLHRIVEKFKKFHFYKEMLNVDFSDEEESSEILVKSQIIVNSASQNLIDVATTSGPSNETQNDLAVESVSEEESEDDSSDSEVSSKYMSATESNTNTEPVQGPSNASSENKTLLKNNSNANNKVIDKLAVKAKPQENPAVSSPIKHNVVPAFKNIPKDMYDMMENRFHMHRDFLQFQKSGKCICSVCARGFPPIIKDIRNHFITVEHKKNAEVYLGKQKYTHYCDLCFKYIRTEMKWAEHLLCPEHRQRVEAIHKIKQPKGGHFKEYECTTCLFVLYGNRASINRHLSETIGTKKKAKKPKEVKLNPKLIVLMRNERLFNEEIHKLSKESDEVLNSIDLSWKCCKGIENALMSLFGPCNAYPFGSRVSGLGNLVSDLDVFVDTGLMFEGMFYQDAESQSKLVNLAARTLKKHKDFADVFAIPSARTPIVQVFHKVTGLDCDLSFRHGLSVENTKFLRLCIDVQPKLKLLILFLKRWSAMSKMVDRVSTYAISMMSIFFMQTRGYLPSVKQLRELDPTESKIIAGWETYCYTKPISELSVLFPPCNLFARELICEFFQFYMKFKFNIEVVCPLLGQTVLKADFYEEKGRRLPGEMKTYVSKINESEVNEVFRSMSPMCVQDPFDLSHNLTKACPVEVVNRFVTLCQLSSVILNKKA